MRVYSSTDIGQKRQINQDFVYTSEESVGNLPNLFVVADGMGGHNAGDFASRYGVSVLVESIKKDKNYNPVKILRNAIESANHEVFRQSLEDEALSGMGSTMVVCTVVGNYAYVANVGDSRMYIACPGLEQISQDHSLIAEMVRLGEISAEEGRVHPDKNIITRAIGTGEDIRIDFFDIKLESSNLIMLCSDGLTNMVSDEEIRSILEGGAPESCAQALVDKANENGGEDNIAVIVVAPFWDEVS